MATYNGNTLTGNEVFVTGDIINFGFSGSSKIVNLIKGIYKLEVWGARGGSGYSYSERDYRYLGNRGGYSIGTLTLNEDTTLYANSGENPPRYWSGTAYGAFNGGGKSNYANGYRKQAGGGASDFRINSNSLYARVIVAGGGSGAMTGNYQRNYNVGGGGGINGGGNGGASQTNGYSFGIGEDSDYSDSGYYGGAGGGWYGGNYELYDGGGGSGYIYTENTEQYYPSGKLIDSRYYLTDAQTISGSGTQKNFPDPIKGDSAHVGVDYNSGYCRITVLEIGPSVTLDSIEITELPDKLIYNVGETLDLTGLIVTGNYSDGSTEIITDYDINSIDVNVAGIKTIIITYETLTTSFEVEYKKIISSIYVNSLPNKIIYNTGETLDLTGLDIKVIYQDNSEESIENYTVEQINNGVPGTKNIVITYENFTTDFDVYYNGEINKFAYIGVIK